MKPSFEYKKNLGSRSSSKKRGRQTSNENVGISKYESLTPPSRISPIRSKARGGYTKYPERGPDVLLGGKARTGNEHYKGGRPSDPTSNRN